jgi:alkylation response protein AidB-like acyl-CoA dehydrogenase
MTQLDNARVGIAAQALGIAQAALEVAVSYAGQRKSFGQPINQFQAVKVREMSTFHVGFDAVVAVTFGRHGYQTGSGASARLEGGG